ncbi:Response regulator containing a CheY-like receiver domain and an HTH DNA-binding domain [Maritimibacter sp. HL-12]|nr:Response regulator containing a CheY-like receiver domain and an HTH DNA-binding domain [Maritimibacter sp. HL-12]
MGQLDDAWGHSSTEYLSVGRSSRGVIALVSGNQTFSERLCRVTEAEVDKVEVSRHDSVDQVIETLPMWRERLRLVVLDETAAGKLDTAVSSWVQDQSAARIACAYCDVDRVRQVFANGCYPAAISSFFPLNLSFDAWISMLKLCLSRHTYVATELIEALSTLPGLQGAPPNRAKAFANAESASWPSSGNNLNRLTQREIEVLKHVAEGYQNKVIAAKLGLSENTVKLHMHHVITKLGVHNRTEAAMIYATAKT